MRKKMILSPFIIVVLILLYGGCSNSGNNTPSVITAGETNTTDTGNDHNTTDNNGTGGHVLLPSDTFPSDFYPTGSRPRLWLTQDRLQEIETQQQNQTQRWGDFKAMCDAIIDTDSDNDPYGLQNSPQNFTAPLALMYLLTQDNRYADKSLALMDAVDLNFSKYGDADHESWYFLALSYDWLHDYPGMSSSKKNAYQNKMHAISDKFWYQYNLTASGTDSDNNLLTGMTHLAFGAALYGDDSNATELLDRGWQGWSKGYGINRSISNRDMVKSALGGIYFTGMAYFPSTDIIGIASYEMTLKSACHYDVNQEDPLIKPFWSNTVEAIIALTEPTKKRISDYGSWQDPNNLYDQPWLRRAMILLGYFSDAAGDTTQAQLAKGYAQAVDIGYTNDYFIELFFTKDNITPRDPYSANLPLVQFFKAPDFMLFRDSWSENASWGEFRGDGAIPLDQQSPDHGHFSLWRNGSYLSKAARNYEALSHGDFFNTLSIENGCTLNGVSCSGTAIFESEAPAQITRHMEHNTPPVFAYSMLEADGQWNDSPDVYQPVSNVQSYRRLFFWTPKYVVVLDRLRANSAVDVRYRLRALHQPLIQGDTVSQLSENNNSRLIQKTLEPSGASNHLLDEAAAWSGIEEWVVNEDQRRWQSYIDFNDTQSVNILNLIQLGDAAMSDLDSWEHLEDAAYSGVRIGNWVVNFSSNEILRDAVTYTINPSSTQTHHLVTDMQNGSYTLRVNGVEKNDLVADTESHALYFDTNVSVQTTIVIAKR